MGVRQARGKKYDLFLLSSRDGYILKDAYGRLRERFPDRLPEGKYFYTSRHAAFLTIMGDIELVKRFIYLSHHENDPPGLLRKRCGLAEDSILPYNGESVEEYFLMHAQAVREAAERYRGSYRKYSENEGLAGRRCAVMDFVSEGSCQLMLEKSVTEEMDGYYVGFPEYVARYARNISYYFDQDLIEYNTEMKTEVYFTSMEPALDHIGEDGRPVFAEESRDPAVLDRIGKIHDEVRRWLNEYIDHLYDPESVPDRDLILELFKTVNNYKVDNHYYNDVTGDIIRVTAQETDVRQNI